MEAGDYIRLKKNRIAFNSYNAKQVDPTSARNKTTQTDSQTLIDYRIGPKVQTFGKIIIFPGCSGPICTSDSYTR
jgi:hypothetical protein